MYVRRDGTPPTPSAFAPSVVCPPLSTIVKSSSGPETNVCPVGVDEFGATETGAAAVSSDARSRSDTGPFVCAVPMRMSTPMLLRTRNPTRSRVPFFTRSRTESVEMGMRSVSSSDSGAKVFDPRNRSGRNSDARMTADGVGVDRVDVVRLDRHRRFQPVKRIRLGDRRDENRAVEMRDHAVDRVLRVALRQRVESNDGARLERVAVRREHEIRLVADRRQADHRRVRLRHAKIVVSASEMACCGQSNGQDFPASRFSAHAAIVVTAIAAVSNVKFSYATRSSCSWR